MAKNKLKWDGTRLLDFTRKNVLNEWKDKTLKLTYWTIEYNNIIVKCIIRKSENALFCVYDEAMSLFGLSKMGTHYVEIGKLVYVLYKININEHNQMSDFLLSQYEQKLVPSLYYKSIRNIYIVRDIFGINTYDRDILVRHSGNYAYFISFRTYNIKDNMLNKTSVSQAGMNKWFIEDGENINSIDVYKYLFSDIKSSEEITEYINRISIRLEEIIDKIDNRVCDVRCRIIEKLQNKLVRMLD